MSRRDERYDLTQFSEIQRLVARFTDPTLTTQELVNAFGDPKETDEEPGFDLRHIDLQPLSDRYAQICISTTSNRFSRQWPYSVNAAFPGKVLFPRQEFVDVYGEFGEGYDTGRLPIWGFMIDSPRVLVNIALSGVGFTADTLEVYSVAVLRNLKDEEELKKAVGKKSRR